eukprot:CAMPEP_0185855252 /NCGR_PEP_ID=MMETSP1354-20130828/25092_1 /TAXON_ID=708628 /ORGANISM="Erythrolobus madagascarensis, Strain CCMP3276" /LENGTH=220 /DNA_ID=CAMNT_0028557227 /DNA_START=120 /DNA_END=782 /DNA_ORIENTATION=+
MERADMIGVELHRVGKKKSILGENFVAEPRGVCCSATGRDDAEERILRSYFSVAKMELGELVYEDADDCEEALNSLSRRCYFLSTHERRREKAAASRRNDYVPLRPSPSAGGGSAASTLRQHASASSSESTEQAEDDEGREQIHPLPVSLEFSQANSRRVQVEPKQVEKSVAWQVAEGREIVQHERSRASDSKDFRRSSLFPSSSLKFHLIRLFFRARYR